MGLTMFHQRGILVHRQGQLWEGDHHLLRKLKILTIINTIKIKIKLTNSHLGILKVNGHQVLITWTIQTKEVPILTFIQELDKVVLMVVLLMVPQSARLPMAWSTVRSWWVNSQSHHQRKEDFISIHRATQPANTTRIRTSDILSSNRSILHITRPMRAMTK